MTLRGIAKLFSVSPPTVLAWIRKLGPEAIEKPIPEKVEAIQLDELRHCLAARAHTKNGKSGLNGSLGSLWIRIQSESLTGQSALDVVLP